MSFSRKACYEPRTWRVGQLALAVTQLLADKASAQSPEIRLSERLQDGTTSLRLLTDPKELEAVCDLRKRALWTHFDRNDGWMQVYLDARSEVLSIDVTAGSAASLEQVLRLFESQLQLTPTEPPSEDAQWDARLSSVERQAVEFHQRMTSLELSLRQVTPRLRCFLSYRVGDTNELAALRMQRFLALLDVEVLTGEGFEPRRVSDKVSERLDNIHFLVLLVLRDGESSWTRDEISAARREGVYVIPVVEEGSRFESGLFGDLEWISVAPGHIGDAYLKLLEAVHFVRRALASAQGSAAQPSRHLQLPGAPAQD